MDFKVWELPALGRVILAVLEDPNDWVKFLSSMLEWQDAWGA